MVIPGTVDTNHIDDDSDDELAAKFVASGLYGDGSARHAVRVLRGTAIDGPDESLDALAASLIKGQ